MTNFANRVARRIEEGDLLPFKSSTSLEFKMHDRFPNLEVASYPGGHYQVWSKKDGSYQLAHGPKKTAWDLGTYASSEAAKAAAIRHLARSGKVPYPAPGDQG